MIHKMCQEHPISEKVLIAPTYSAGRQLLQFYTLKGYSAVNLRIETITSIAEKLVKPYLLQHTLKAIPPVLARHYILSCFESAKDRGELKYFYELEVTPGVIRSIHQAILELKLSGLRPNDLLPEAFISKNKAEDLQHIFSAYEEMITKNRYVDYSDMLRIAIEKGKSNRSKVVYIAIQHEKFHPLEEELLQTLVNVDERCLNLRETQIDKADINKQLGISMFQANGENNEVREVLRQIKKEKLPFDQVTILYTSKEPYTQLFYDLANRHQIPVTFGQGVNIRNTAPAQLFLGLLQWIRNDFQLTDFVRLLQQGHLRIKEEGPSSTRMISRLRDAEISWGLDNYTSLLQAKLTRLDEQLEKMTQPEESYQFKLREEFAWLKNWFEIFIGEFPRDVAHARTQEPISYGELAQTLKSILEKYSPDKDPLDKAAKEKIVHELEVLTELGDAKSFEECRLLFSEMMEGLSVGASQPSPGHIHVTSYKNGVWTQRPYTFLVGLDAQRFPGQIKEDPILLDGERQKLSHGLHLRKDNPKEAKGMMDQLLSEMEGQLTLSYPAFDPIENREAHPSSYLLEVYRKKVGNSFAQFQELRESLGETKGYIPENLEAPVDEGEWWLHKLFNNEYDQVREAIFLAHPHLEKGLLARAGKESNVFTPFDGRITGDLSSLDPRKNKELILSSSRLELLGKCPYAYFLKYVLKIEEPNEQEYDLGKWLNPAQRGSLLHKIYEIFSRELAARGEKPKVSEHESLLMQVVEDCLAEQRELLPPPSELVYTYEKEELLQSCRVFLSVEEEYSEEGVPEHFELAFGTKKRSEVADGAEEDAENMKDGTEDAKDAEAKTGEAEEAEVETKADVELEAATEAVPITLPSGETFYLRGFIDRVDKLHDGSYLILDYKTGSTYSYDENGYLKGGRQLQHTLYALALEYIFQQKGVEEAPKVHQSGYYFPTVKGEGQRVMRPQNQRESFLEALEDLLDIISHGHFTVTDDTKNDCKFCEYRTVCDPHIYKDSFSIKAEDQTAHGIDKLRRVRDYD